MYKKPALLILATALQACNVVTFTPPAIPAVGTATLNTANQATVITNGHTVTLPAQSGTWGVASSPVYANATTLAGGSMTTYAIAMAGRQNGSYFAGYNGAGTSVPTTGSAALLGEYYVVDGTGASNGIIGLSADFGTGTIAGIGGSGANAVSAAGSISGSDVTGTVTYKGNSGVWKGGFFVPPNSALTYEIMSGFTGTNFAGVISATQ